MVIIAGARVRRAVWCSLVQFGAVWKFEKSLKLTSLVRKGQIAVILSCLPGSTRSLFSFFSFFASPGDRRTTVPDRRLTAGRSSLVQLTTSHPPTRGDLCRARQPVGSPEAGSGRPSRPVEGSRWPPERQLSITPSTPTCQLHHTIHIPRTLCSLLP